MRGEQVVSPGRLRRQLALSRPEGEHLFDAAGDETFNVLAAAFGARGVDLGTQLLGHGAKIHQLRTDRQHH